MTVAALDVRRASRPWPVPVVLGLHEGWRLVRHPVALLGLAATVTVVVAEGDNGPRAAFETIAAAPTFFYGVLVYFAAHLVASRDRRAHSGELLAAAPSPATSRTAALCLAALVPALVCAVFVYAVDALNSARGLYDVPPTVWHLAQAPLTVLGGALLGVMVARLTSVPGVALLVMIAMVMADAWLNSRPETVQPLATYVTWPRYGPHPDTWYGFYPGSVEWHVAYLAALCTMAATGAFLRDAVHRERVLLIGAGATAAAVLTGLAQLP